MKKIVISGYYGFDNAGDEAVLLAIITALRKHVPDINLVVLSANPEKTTKTYGVKAVNRWNPIKVFATLINTHLLISGGGSLLQDATSTRSPWYYLGIIKMALFLRKKVMIYAQGIGPLTDNNNRKQVAKTLNKLKIITVRDEASKILLHEIRVRREIKVTCDPVLGLMEESNEPKKVSKNLLVMVRAWGENRHLDAIAEFLENQIDNGFEVSFLPAHTPDDSIASSLVARMIKGNYKIIEGPVSAEELLEYVKNTDYVFSMRLHGLITATVMAKPMIALSYDPKVDAFMEQINMSKYCLSLEDFNSAMINPLFDELIKQDTEIRQHIYSVSKDLKEIAEENVKLVYNFLTGKR